ncbi:RNA-dependent RNA polymerase [Abu Mina virus]|uniref:RNA-directed RNA polymerase L n=2 Tax=Abu Mina virus TaxID=248059 RepID=A0A191KW46_9VIRU|nr:RNA-dependent RNA polymerase [Abu Mina virus]AMT75374.1 RNA-dependent RNA polymerase [Abu Mina virus]
MSLVHLDDLNWELNHTGAYYCGTRFNLKEFFDIEAVPGDGNCLFYSVSYLLFDTLSEWRSLKNTIATFALTNWSECSLAQIDYKSSHEYISDLDKTHYWGGTVEAEIISKALKSTVIIWCADVLDNVTDAFKYGAEPVSRSINLRLANAHFSPLKLTPLPQGVSTRLELGVTQSVLSPIIADEEEQLEDIIMDEPEAPETETLPERQDYNRSRSDLFSKASVDKILTMAKKAVEDNSSVSVRVGRILFRLFSCNVCLDIKDDMLTVMQKDENSSRKGMELSKLAHVLLTNDKRLQESYCNLVLAIDRGLLQFLNVPEMLRIALPGSCASQFYDLMHPDFIYDLCLLVVAILLSTFLYKTEYWVKQQFIDNAVAPSKFLTKGARGLLKAHSNKALYDGLSKFIPLLCDSCFGEYANKIVEALREMPPTGLLVLKNLNLDTVKLEDYGSILDDLRVISVDQDFFRLDELQEIKRLIDALYDIRQSEPLINMDNVPRSVLTFMDCEAKDLFKTSSGKTLKHIKAPNLEMLVIKKFFQKKLMMKFVSLQGKAYSGATVSNVLAYCNNLYLTKEQLGFNVDDIEQLRCEMVRLRSLISNEMKEPVAIICDKLEESFSKLFNALPESCKLECKSLFEDIRNSDNHASAWKSALRLKGLAYEGLMSQCYNLSYIPEDLKPTLSMIIQTLFPSKFLQFLERTHLHPEFRDIVPDFVITQRLALKQDTLVPQAETQQLTLDPMAEEDSAEVIPVGKKRFPLPSHAFKEVSNVDWLREHLERRKEDTKRTTGLTVCTTGVSTDNINTESTPELLILEVGYQTDVEGKVSSDIKKWSEIIKLLKYLGIKATLVACADSSECPSNDWWIKEEYVKLLKGSISYLFSQLQLNSPSEVTDIVVGSISTQKIRSMLKSGTAVKTPVTIKELKECWKEHKKSILCRPTNTKLPDRFEEIFELSMVEGVVVEKNAAKEIVDHILANSNVLIQEFEKTKYKHEVNKRELTAARMIISWLKEDLAASRCTECKTKIVQTVKDYVNHADTMITIATELPYSRHPECCHANKIDYDLKSFFNKRVMSLNVVKHKEQISAEDSSYKSTALDRLVRLTLPGKTEKERKIKRGVEQLIRLCMECSNINAIKLSNGLIVGNKKEILSNKKILNSEPGEPKPITLEQQKRLEKLRQQLAKDKMKTYSDLCKDTIHEVINAINTQQASKCKLDPNWVRNIFTELKADTDDVAVVEKFLCTLSKKRNVTQNNDKVIIPSQQDLIWYVQDKLADLTPCNEKVFDLDCILFKETILECVIRLFDTPYWDCIEMIQKTAEQLLEFNWYQKIVYYGKMCETFLQCCTEFSRSGIKVMKIRHTNMNLAIKVPANRKENMKCVIYDANFTPVTQVFMLNRRVAVLGASYYYIIIIVFIQCLQHCRCIQSVKGELKTKEICTVASKLGDTALKCLSLAHQGRYKEARDALVNKCQENGNFLSKGTEEHYITVFAGLSLTYSVLLGDSLLLNSQPFNKQLQMMRFGMLNGLSMLSSPDELGKKFHSSCRRIELHVSRLYLQLVTYSCCFDPAQNCDEWKLNDLCPNVTLPSLSIFGHFINSDRQLIFDIYNVHIYNKEMDNFDEGTIKVLEETAERHMTWEIDVADCCQRIAESDKGSRCLRLLLGLPNVKRSAVDSQVACDDDALSDISSISNKSLESGSSGQSKFKSYFGRISMQKKPFSISDSFVVDRFEKQDYTQAITDKWTHNVYKPNKSSVLKDAIEVIRKNPSHTMGCFELVQCFTEMARTKFPNESIEKTRRHPNNYITVSEVTETTSIVASPRTHIMLKDCLRILMGLENKKLVKMVRGKFQRLGLSLSPDNLRTHNLSDLLDTVDSLTEKQKKDIIKGIVEPSKLSFFSWKEIIKKGVESALITQDGNYIYCWIKSLGHMVKRSLKKYVRGLRYDLNAPQRNRLTEAASIKFGKPIVEDCVRFIEALKKTIRGENDNFADCSPKSLLELWTGFALECRDGSLIIKSGMESTQQCLALLEEILDKYNELTCLKEEFPALCFTREEVELRNAELKFIKDNNKEIMSVVNCLLYICLTCPWCLHYKSMETLMSKHLDGDCKLDVGNKQLKELLESPISSTWLSAAEKLYLGAENTPLYDESGKITHKRLDRLCRYACAIFTSNSHPINCALNQVGSDDVARDQGQIVERVKIVLAKMGITAVGTDFTWTCHLIANSNFEVSKKLTGRTTGERLPRSVRSKVIYEVIKLVGDTGMAILQQLAFSAILNNNHQFFAVLAPKAQLGGHRDLLVQEVGTKLIHATTEMFSRTLLSTTNDDGLTNQHLKETILTTGLNKIGLMLKHHGETVAEEASLKQFFRVFCISGDNTKWGPIHCCSIFSAMMQQLLKDFQDWSSFYKLTFLKNLFRQVEIPSASIKKILNAFRYNSQGKFNVDELTEVQLREKLLDCISIWDSQPIIKFLIVTYISQGKCAMTSYNHMGQGIHHATSSILTSIMADALNAFIETYLYRRFPKLTTTIEHAGSSDDYAKVITVSGIVDEQTFVNYNKLFWPVMCKVKNLMAAVGRVCQMKDSAKTLCGDTFVEFYSEFMLTHRITPAVIKFILTGLINSSVTSPQSMSQACQVSSQQAMYNSVPLLTNITFTILRQQMFMNHTEYFSRNYGPITSGSISSFGRLFIPKFSNLITSSIALEDSETISLALRDLSQNELDFPTSLEEVKPPPDPLETKKDTDEADAAEVGSTSNVSLTSGSSLSSGSSFSFRTDRNLNSTEQEYLKTVRTTIEEVKSRAISDYCAKLIGDIEGLTIITKLRNSNLVNSCEYLSKVKDNPLLLIYRVRCVFIALIASFYRTFSSEGTEKTVKASLNRDNNTIIEDPMIQLVPEKLRRELERLGLSKMTVDELVPTPSFDEEFSSIVAKRLITMNCATESYESEISRLKQTLTSRNVIHGLAGGIKELSVPIYTIFMKSYFFKDNIFFDLSDRWNTKHSSNYRDSMGRKLEGKIVTKFSYWIDVFLSCNLTIGLKTNEGPVSLFDPLLKAIDIIKKEKAAPELVLEPTSLTTMYKEFENLSLQFSDNNRHKLKVLESARHRLELDSNKVVIVKSSLFTATDSVRIDNNPAVVIGYMISETSLTDLKPVKVDMSRLIQDRFKIVLFYPTLTELVSKITSESKEIVELNQIADIEKADQYAKNLTMLCRMVQQTKSKLTSFYMIKTSSLSNEPTVSELVSYGVKEGSYLVLEEQDIDTSTYSVRYWKVLQCISCIASLPINENEKTSLLISFLNWKPSIAQLDHSCGLYKYDKTILEEFDDKVIMNVLSSELPSIRNEREREGVRDLVEFVSFPNQLIVRKPYLGVTETFQKWGEGQKTGKFTFSSSSGESTGIFISGLLHITLSNDSPSLLHQVEKRVLEWLGHLRSEIVSIEQHGTFLSLLADMSSVSRKAVDGRLLTPRIDDENPRYLKLSPVPTKKPCKVVKVKKGILSVRKEVVKEIHSEPRLLWKPNSLTIIYDENVEKITYHEQILNIHKIVNQVINKETTKLPSTFYQDSKVVLSKLKLQPQMYISSVSLMHCFFCHTLQDSVLEACSKSAVLTQYLHSGFRSTSREKQRIQIKLVDTSLDTKPDTRFLDNEVVCKQLADQLNYQNVSETAWPEVQRILDESGYHTLSVGLEQKPNAGHLTWTVNQDSSLGFAAVQTNLRQFINSICSLVLPRCLTPFLTDGALLGETMQLCHSAKQEINRYSLGDKDLSAICCIAVYMFDTDNTVRKELCFNNQGLLNMASTTTFNINEFAEVRIVQEPDQVVLHCTISTSPTRKESRIERGLEFSQTRILNSYNSIFNSVNIIDKVGDICDTYASYKIDKQSFAEFTMSSQKAFYTTCSKLYQGLTGRKLSVLVEDLSVFNLCLLLLGKSQSNRKQETCSPDSDSDIEYTADELFGKKKTQVKNNKPPAAVPDKDSNNIDESEDLGTNRTSHSDTESTVDEIDKGSYFFGW